MGKEEAIREIKRFMSIIPNDMQEAIMVLVPELAESEDERIRKELKEAFEAYDIESTWNGIPIRSIFAGLEKQKGQKQECGEKGMKGPQEIGYWRGDEGVCKKQKEQPKVYLNENTMKKEFRMIDSACLLFNYDKLSREQLIARRFYQLGLKARKEK